jgi:DNA modification methylase
LNQLKNYLFYEDDWATIYCGNCFKILPKIPKTNTAIVTDPPYGTGFDFTKKRKGRKTGLNWATENNADKDREWSPMIGDTSILDPTSFLEFKEVILWGGNNYPGLHPSRGWLVWDKRKDSTQDNHGDAELAYTNLDMPIRIHRQIWRGIVREGDENLSRTSKFHPTQKPVALMRWCIQFVTAQIIFDPFMGSGTTCVAAKSLNRKSIGIEIEPKYCEIAVKRLRQEVFDFRKLT